jgi:PleD family two-component response regulator
VIASIASSGVEAVERATSAGADLVTTRPHDVERLAPVLLAAARLTNERRISTTAKGAEQVLRARLEELSDPEPRGLQPFELFQRTLEVEIKRARRFEYPLSVALFAVEVPPPPPPAGIRGILRARAGNALIHTIRDIDMATQLDHERFLVLLPYTDLTGAANVGRRVIAAVAEHDPVVSAGRSFKPKVVGAVAGSTPGQELSFAKLMKDATRALEQARRDGAELAVQP